MVIVTRQAPDMREDGDEGFQEGPHPGQLAGVGPVRGGGRRQVPDRPPAAGRGAAAGARRTPGASSTDQIREIVADQFQAYQTSLSANRRRLLERFTIVDMARKVVGVGSVGTRAWMVLLEGRDTGDPLFLQVKEATRSVLEDHLP